MRTNRKRCYLAAAVASLAVPGLVRAGATFNVQDADLGTPPTVLAYGDMRFTDPSEHSATNPNVRRWLVDRVASEKPDAIVISGDLPWHGGNKSDYEIFAQETKIWRDNHLRVYPALGNHELYGHSIVKNEQQGLQNWWEAFPELKGRRWYSVQLGSRIYVLNLDSNSSLHTGSQQREWVEGELASLPSSIEFVFVNLHHPPVADYQRFGDPTHNPGSNEIGLAKYLNTVAPHSRVRYIVIAGHVHNYERFLEDEVTYLVSGGGGAAPRSIHRSSSDLYRDAPFPNYHYVKFVLSGEKIDATMYRVADPDALSPTFEVKDHFVIAASKMR